MPLTFFQKYVYAANNPLSFIDPSGRFIPVLLGFGAVGIGAAMGGLGGALIAALAWLALDPASFASGVLVVLEIALSPITLLETGKFPKFEVMGGGNVIGVRNSFFARRARDIGGREGFALGAAFFLTEEGWDEAWRHEFGHSLQWMAMGGWGYLSYAIGSGFGETGEFEWDADLKAGDYFNTPICNYWDVSHPDPRCRK